MKIKVRLLMFIYSFREKFIENILGWVGVILVLSGYILNAQKMPSCWLLWIAGNSMVSAYCIKQKTYPTAVMSMLLVVLNVYGYSKWMNLI